MPTHVYTGLRRPPSWRDHVLAHPYEIVLSMYAIIGGLLAFASAFVENMTVSQSLDQLPALLAATAGALLVFGGGGILHGLFDNSEELGVGFTSERMGLSLQSSGWGIYAVCIAFLNVTSVLSWGLCLAIVVANALRFAATLIQENGIRADVKRGLANGDQ